MKQATLAPNPQFDLSEVKLKPASIQSWSDEPFIKNRGKLTIANRYIGIVRFKDSWGLAGPPLQRQRSSFNLSNVVGPDYLDFSFKIGDLKQFHFFGLRKTKQFLDKINPTGNEPGVTSDAPKRKRNDASSKAASKRKAKARKNTDKWNQWCALAVWVILDRKRSC